MGNENKLQSIRMCHESAERPKNREKKNKETSKSKEEEK